MLLQLTFDMQLILRSTTFIRRWLIWSFQFQFRFQFLFRDLVLVLLLHHEDGRWRHTIFFNDESSLKDTQVPQPDPLIPFLASLPHCRIRAGVSPSTTARAAPAWVQAYLTALTATGSWEQVNSLFHLFRLFTPASRLQRIFHFQLARPVSPHLD